MFKAKASKAFMTASLIGSIHTIGLFVMVVFLGELAVLARREAGGPGAVCRVRGEAPSGQVAQH